MTMPTLFDSLVEDDKTSIDVRFARFHERYPEVYQAILRIARLQRDLGRRGLTMKWVVECIRADASITRDGDSPVKINNDYNSRYTRKLQAEYPDLGALFNTRGLRS